MEVPGIYSNSGIASRGIPRVGLEINTSAAVFTDISTKSDMTELKELKEILEAQ